MSPSSESDFDEVDHDETYQPMQYHRNRLTLQQSPPKTRGITVTEDVKVKNNVTVTQGNILAREGLHPAHFLAADCVMDRVVSKISVEKGKISQAVLLQYQPKAGNVFVSRQGTECYVAMICKEKLTDATNMLMIKKCLSALMQLLKRENALVRSNIKGCIRTLSFRSDISSTLCEGLITVPPPADRQDIVKELHGSRIGRHKGITKTYRRILSQYYWRGMKNEIQEFIRYCLDCQGNKLVRVKNKAPMIITDSPPTIRQGRHGHRRTTSGNRNLIFVKVIPTSTPGAAWVSDCQGSEIDKLTRWAPLSFQRN